MVDESTANPSGPLLGMGQFTWEFNSTLHGTEVKKMRGMCPLSGSYTLYFICRTHEETVMLVELMRCSNIADQAQAALRTLQTYIKLVGPPGLIAPPVAFECLAFNADDSAVVSTTTTTSSTRPAAISQDPLKMLRLALNDLSGPSSVSSTEVSFACM